MTNVSDKKLARTLKGLASNNVVLRRKAARRLGQTGNVSAIDALRLSLSDPDRFVRREAAKSLGIIGDPSAVEPLLTTLSDRSASVRRHAVEALGAIGDKRAIEPLCDRLYDSNPHVRQSASHSLTLIGQAAAVTLCRRMKAPNTKLRLEARLALIEILQRHTPETQMLLLADHSLTAEERCRYLEILLHFYSEPFSFFSFGRRKIHLSSVQHFCEFVLQSDYKVDSDIKAGARAVLDYLSLGRASQKDPTTGADILLRPVEETLQTNGANILLRASHSEAERDSSQESFMDKIKRWFGFEP